MGVFLRPRYAAAALFCCAALSACGGGGGTGGSMPPGGGSTPTPTQSPATTNASGIVVDDANGSPVAGVRVKLVPWAPCGPTPSPATSIAPESDGCPTPLPSPQTTTNASGQFTLNGVPNGHYLLVIGADAVATVPPGYTTPPSNCGGPCPTPTPVAGTPAQATVHDNITLTGGNQTLKAPTLPSVSMGYTVPRWETNGDYRIATLDATTEMPCYVAWQYERSQKGLAGGAVDEWVTENARADNAFDQVAPAGSTSQFITRGNTFDSGGTACGASLVTAGVFATNSYAADPRALWFAGQYIPYSGGTASATGVAEFPIDPRAYTDPVLAIWP